MLDTPDVSVVIPTRDRPLELGLCLEALDKQDFGGCFEVLIGDDGTLPIRINSNDSSRYRVRVFRAARRGAAAARMACVHNAQAQMIGFLDDDAIPAFDWVTELARALSEAGGANVVTGCITPIQNGILSKARQARYDDRQADARKRPDRRAQFFAGGNSGVWKLSFLDVGGFAVNYPLMHDAAFLEALKQKGGSCFYEPRLVIRHLHVKSFTDPFKNAFVSGRVKASMSVNLGTEQPDFWTEVKRSLLSITTGSGKGASDVNRVNGFLHLIHLSGRASSIVFGTK